MQTGGSYLPLSVCEDNLVNQKVLTRYLTRVGLEVEVAGDGEEFVKEFLSHPPNYYSLILCDLFMPVKGKRSAQQVDVCSNDINLVLRRWL